MKGQHVYTLDVAQTGGELRNLLYVLSVASQPGHQHEAQPDRPSTLRQPTRKIQRRADLLARELAVALGVPSLDVQERQVYSLQLLVREALAQMAVGI